MLLPCIKDAAGYKLLIMALLAGYRLQCPTVNICVAAAGVAGLCNTSYDQLPPLPLAEDLCPRALASVLEMEMASYPDMEPTPKNQAVFDYKLGSLYLELALSSDISARTVDSYFGVAGQYLTRSASTVHSRESLAASFLNVFLPAFMDRGQYTVPPTTVHTIRQRLLEKAKRPIFSSSASMGAKGRIGLHLLYMREGLMAFPATAREYMPAPDRPGFSSPQSHSLYTLYEDKGVTHKLPHRTERGKNTAHTRQVVARFGMLAWEAMQALLPKPPRDDAKAGRMAFDWLYAEAAGYVLSTAEEQVIIRMGQKLRERREGYIRHQQN